jgi:hypothetical protein
MAEDEEAWAQYRLLLRSILPENPPPPSGSLSDIPLVEAPAPNTVEIELDDTSEFDRRFLEQEHDHGEIGAIRSPHDTPLIDLPYMTGPPVIPGCLLADENRVPVTRVLDLIGPIENPQMILKGQFPIGLKLFAVEGDAVFPNPEQIESAYRGCDASNRYDEPEEHPEFSDDEEEHQHKMEQRRQKEGGYPRS